MRVTEKASENRPLVFAISHCNLAASCWEAEKGHSQLPGLWSGNGCEWGARGVPVGVVPGSYRGGKARDGHSKVTFPESAHWSVSPIWWPAMALWGVSGQGFFCLLCTKDALLH